MTHVSVRSEDKARVLPIRLLRPVPPFESITESDASCITIAFMMVHDFSMIAFASAVEPLRLANRAHGASPGVPLARADQRRPPRARHRMVLRGAGRGHVTTERQVRGQSRRSCAPAIDVQTFDTSRDHRPAARDWPRRGVPPWGRSAPAPMFWRGPVCSTDTVAPSTGRISTVSTRSFRSSRSLRSCSNSIARGSPAPAARLPST